MAKLSDGVWDLVVAKYFYWTFVKRRLYNGNFCIFLYLVLQQKYVISVERITVRNYINKTVTNSESILVPSGIVSKRMFVSAVLFTSKFCLSGIVYMQSLDQEYLLLYWFCHAVFFIICNTDSNLYLVFLIFL